MPNPFRNDALLLPSDLEAYDAVLYEPKEEELIARQLIRVRTEDPEWAEYLSYDKLSRIGMAKIMSVLSNNVPLVDVDVDRTSRRVYSIVTGWRITATELSAARANGRNPDTYKAATARRFVAMLEDSLVFAGDAGYNIEGLLNLTGRLEAAASAKFDSGTTHWADATPTEGMVMISHIKQARAALNATAGYSAKALVVSPTNFEIMAATFLTSEASKTVLDFIREAEWFPGGIFKSANVPDDRLLVLDNLPENMEVAVPKDISRYDPYQEGPFSWIIAVEERCAGVLVRYPLSVSVVTGLAA